MRATLIHVSRNIENTNAIARMRRSNFYIHKRLKRFVRGGKLVRHVILRLLF